MVKSESNSVNVVLRACAELSPEALAALFIASWPGSGAPCFELHRSLCWVSAHAGERLVGFVNVAWDGGAHAFVLDTTVHPDFRRHGIGQGLVQCAVDEARERGAEYLHVDYEPRHAELYRRCGFRPTLAGLIRLLQEPTQADAPESRDPSRLTLRKYTAADVGACRELMAGLGDWFVTHSAREGYLADLPRIPTWVGTLTGDAGVAGFVSVTRPQPRAFELHVLAVARARHRQGIGRALLGLAERWSAAQGGRFMQVKTLGPSCSDPAYVETRAFYQRLGYEPLLESEGFWGKGNPALLLVKAIG
jgi:GNAT superfamily N-acetyltransferase